MLRWFYANEELICEKRAIADGSLKSHPSEESIDLGFTYRFCVTLKKWNLLRNEILAVSGDCDELGNWDHAKSVLMEPTYDGRSDSWQTFIRFPTERNIFYRYVILAIDPTNNQKIVRFFESHLHAREVPAKKKAIVDVCEDVFGYIDGEYKVERGWLTSERVIQFIFSKGFFKLENSDLAGHTLSVKVTPYNRRESSKCHRLFIHDKLPPLVLTPGSKNIVCNEAKLAEMFYKQGAKIMKADRLCPKKVKSFTKLDLSISKDNVCKERRIAEELCPEEACLEKSHPEKSRPEKPRSEKSHYGKSQPEKGASKEEALPENLSTAFAFSEAVSSSAAKGSLGYQPKFGTKIKADDRVTIHLTIGDFNNTVYLIEIFMFSRYGLKEHPYCLGYRYVMPEDFLLNKQGYMEVPIICESKHRLIGFITFRFLIADPCPKLKFDLSTSYLRYFRKKFMPMIAGHRGMGKTFISSEGTLLYENTLYSMRKVVENGIRMVEFDVHLTRDLVPVIYHDFNIHVSLKDQKLLQDFNHINIPISHFTYNELMDLKIYDADEFPRVSRIGDAPERLRLFPKLSELLDDLQEVIAVDIEIKSPQQFCRSMWEEGIRPIVDPNKFVDRVLEVVIPKTKTRRVFFSSFDPDIVTLLRFKQNRYPVLLNINDDSGPQYLDPRVKNPSAAVSFAWNMELLGVTFRASMILKYPFLSKKAEDNDLIILTHGIDDFEVIKDLKHLKVNGLILDRIDKYVEYQNQLAANIVSSDDKSLVSQNK